MANSNNSPESVVREIKRKTRRVFNAEEKIQIVLKGLRGEQAINALCRREGIHTSQYYKWSKEFLEAGNKYRKKLSGKNLSLDLGRPYICYIAYARYIWRIVRVRTCIGGYPECAHDEVGPRGNPRSASQKKVHFIPGALAIP
jgi:hypothetical protein